MPSLTPPSRMPQDVAQYRSRFGDDYFSFWVGGVFYIAINSQYYCDDSRVKNLREEQETSAAPLLSVARGAILIRVRLLPAAKPSCFASP